MHSAVRNNQKDEVLKLIETDVQSVNQFDEFFLTPLHIAAYEGFFDIAFLLLEHGADVNLRDRNGWTSLHCAANRGFLDICEVMIEQGTADVSAVTEQHTSALHYLARLAGKSDSDFNIITNLGGFLIRCFFFFFFFFAFGTSMQLLQPREPCFGEYWSSWSSRTATSTPETHPEKRHFTKYSEQKKISLNVLLMIACV